MSLEFSLKCSQTLKTSLLTADCSKYFAAALGRRSWKAVSVVQSVPRSMMNAGVVDQEVHRQAVQSQWNDGIPASVAFPKSSFVSTNAATRDWETE